MKYRKNISSIIKESYNNDEIPSKGTEYEI
jgi:hypothetical protein